MQKFYTDKSKIFECNISVDGAKLNETKARLILEFPNKRNLLFHGKINEDGKCRIQIPALKEMEEGEGNAVLEIIAESTHFESWKDKFKLETNKKVQVEMVEHNDKEIIAETKITPHVEIISENVEEKRKIIEESITLKSFKNFLNENNLDYNLVIKNKSAFLGILNEFKNDFSLTKEDIFEVVDEIKENVKNSKILKS